MGSGFSRNNDKDVGADDLERPESADDTSCSGCKEKDETIRNLQGQQQSQKSSQDEKMGNEDSANLMCFDCRKSNVTNGTREAPPKRSTDGRSPRLFNNGIETVPIYDHVSSVNSTKRFFFYPEKAQTDPNESLFVSTSQFPYTKPKAVPVKRMTNVSGELFHYSTGNTVTSTRGSNGVEQERHEQHPKLESDLNRYTLKHLQSGNERQWSAPNSHSTRRAGTVRNDATSSTLPHRTILELRQSHCQPYGRRYDFTCDLPVQTTAFPANLLDADARLPSPECRDWFPTLRTEEYLVASSLLALEEKIDRARLERDNGDIHDF